MNKNSSMKNDGYDSFDSSINSSSSNSSHFDSNSKECCSASPTTSSLGWPIRKAQVNGKCEDEVKIKQCLVDDDLNLKMKNMGSTVSG